jgi:glycosyltransferase involved in cell wall biosynthesis
MGKIIPIGDSNALAAAMIEILANPTAFRREIAPIKECYQPDTIAVAYEKLFLEMQEELHDKEKTSHKD